jgi:hypothetical protein
MASEVKGQKIHAEEMRALPDRYNRNICLHARLLRRTLSLAVSATRLHQTTLRGQNHLTSCLGLATADQSLEKLLRASC